MVLNLQHVSAHVRDTLGGGTIPVDLDEIGILNQAGEHLHSMHPWRWAQGRSTLLSLRGLVSGTTATWTASSPTNTLTATAAFTDYTFVEGDEVEIISGTGATAGFYTVESRTSANAIVLSSAIAAGALATGDISWSLQPLSIDLPDDCRDIIAIQGTGDASRTMTLTSLQEVLDIRDTLVSTSWSYYAAVSYVGSPPTPILEIAPGSGDNATGAFRMFYRKRWLRLTADNSEIAVPEFCEALLLQIVRAFARGYVREDVSTLDERLLQIHLGPVFNAAKRSDTMLQPYGGMLRGGGATIHRRSKGQPFLRERVNPPA